MKVKSGLEKNTFKFHKPLQRYLLNYFLDRFFFLHWAGENQNVSIGDLDLRKISTCKLTYIRHFLEQSVFRVTPLQIKFFLLMNHQLLSNNSAEEVCNFLDFLEKVFM